MSNTFTQDLVLNASSRAYIGQVITMAGNVIPQGCLALDGQTLQISDYEELFTIIGTEFGGDGITTFNVPNIEGKTIFNQGNGMVFGSSQGQESVTLSEDQMPAHNHLVNVSSDIGNTNTPSGGFLANTGAFDNEYANTLSNPTTLNTGAVSETGGTTPVNLINPSLVLNMVIVAKNSFNCCQ